MNRFVAMIAVGGLILMSCSGDDSSGDDMATSAVTEPAATEPATTEPDVTEPAATGPEVTGPASREDHQVELAIGENEFVTRFVVPVDGYRYENDDGGTYEDVGAILEAVEPIIGTDVFGAFSLHSVVGDDPSQNTARARNGDWEVGWLELIQLSEVIPFGADKDWSELAAALAIGDRPYEAIGQLDLSGTAVFVFESPELPDSRFHYAWLDHGVGGILDGADRAPLERWLEAYLRVPKLAESETVEMAERLVAVPGFRYSNVDPDTLVEFEQPPTDVPHSLHFVADRNGSIGMLAIAPKAHAAELQNWLRQFADFRVTDGLDVRGHRVEVLDGGFDERPLRAYAWDDGLYAGVLTTNPDMEEQVLTYIDAFVDT